MEGRDTHTAGSGHGKIFVLGTSSFVEELCKNGLNVTQEAEDGLCCIVAAYDSELTYQKLTLAWQGPCRLPGAFLCYQPRPVLPGRFWLHTGLRGHM
jgi:ribonucleotide monophosphatase NagD (HAD superfamily)